jgi:hypothetical protein
MMSPDTADDQKPHRGWKRMRQLRQQDQAKRQELVAELLGGLNRKPSAVDKVAADSIAALFIKANRLESQGKDSTEVRRLILQSMRTSGFRPSKAEAPAPLSIQEQLRQRGYTEPDTAGTAEKAAAEAS